MLTAALAELLALALELDEVAVAEPDDDPALLVEAAEVELAVPDNVVDEAEPDVDEPEAEDDELLAF